MNFILAHGKWLLTNWHKEANYLGISAREPERMARAFRVV